MKRTHSIFVIMAFVVAALCLVSCEETTPVVGEEQTIPGRWKCTASTTPPEGATFWIRKDETIIISDDKSYDLDHGDGTAELGLCEWSTNEIRFKPLTQRDYFVFEYSTRTYSIILYSRGHQIRLDRLYTD